MEIRDERGAFNRLARAVSKQVEDAPRIFEEMDSLSGNATPTEIFRIVQKMRFPVMLNKNGKKIFPMEGKLTRKEYAIVKDLLKWDDERGQFITEKPAEVLHRLFKEKLLKGDRFAALKYTIAVSNGDMEKASETADLWKMYLQRFDEPSVALLHESEFAGRWEDFLIKMKEKKGLELADVVKKISDSPPIYRSIYEDASGKRYVVLSGGLGARGTDAYNQYTIVWDEGVMNKPANLVINAFLLGSTDNSLFTGIGRIVEEKRMKELLYSLIEFTKFSLVKDDFSHKYIVLAGIEVDERTTIPVVRAEFSSYERAKLFISEELLPKYVKAREELLAMMDDLVKEFSVQKKMEKELSIGGMYV